MLEKDLSNPTDKYVIGYQSAKSEGCVWSIIFTGVIMHIFMNKITTIHNEATKMYFGERDRMISFLEKSFWIYQAILAAAMAILHYTQHKV